MWDSNQRRDEYWSGAFTPKQGSSTRGTYGSIGEQQSHQTQDKGSLGTHDVREPDQELHSLAWQCGIKYSMLQALATVRYALLLEKIYRECPSP